MKENIKYNEALHFYEQMKLNKMNPSVFEYNLSAFLTSARTVFQYAREESQAINGGQKWYDQIVSFSPIIRFLKDKRDNNIHTEPVDPQSIIALSYNLNMNIKVTFTKFDKDGKIVSQSPTNESFESSPQKRSSSDIIYRFKDWSGSEDIITLCGLYLDEIDGFISDGVTKSFILG